ncbi:glycoside hydrolase family 76 protein [Aulographum hederae CBS 113979]|uniref:Mannan endo-1,6-alpha-mannosidase n=1 Tax=Aulographum hederae CBS 113979 TaxID=1176131 RepID=A0A6G1GRN1_9PEZI|nr:glycoside hydrolase family 76 protein [Aulographum hederae CBS 113979]
MRGFTISCVALALASGSSAQLNLDVSSQDSISSAARAIAGSVVDLYKKTSDREGAIGVFGRPYYWWESGLAWNSLIGYWYLTGDAQYNDLISESLLAQIGPNSDYMVPNITNTEANDDQATWALAALTAEEFNFPKPVSGPTTWQSLAVSVFNTQIARWDAETCAGGLRWQIFAFNNGYNYKNSFSAATFFQLAARLALQTGNQTYADWASQQYTWLNEIDLIDDRFRVFDGTEVTTNCSSVNHLQWSANAGTLLHGAAAMYNMTSSPEWRSVVAGLLNSTASTFFEDNVMFEAACEPSGNCNTDQLAYKGILARAMALTSQLAPFTASTISPLLRASAEGAAAACQNDIDGIVCGTSWTGGGLNGDEGLSQDISALEVVQANLIPRAAAPEGAAGTATTGGNETSTVTGPRGGTSSVVPTGEGNGVFVGVTSIVVLATLVVQMLV